MTRFDEVIQKNSRPLLGVSTYFYDPIFVEMAAHAGFQGLWIETEHAHISFAEAADLCRIASGSGLLTMIRIPDTRRENVLKAAECGPDIIDVPMANSPEVLQELVRHARFTPSGERGYFTVSRAARYGMIGDVSGEQLRINRELCLMVQVETQEAVDRADELCAVSGIDAIFLGLGDLSASLGVPGQTRHPKVLEGAMRTIVTAKRFGKKIALMDGPVQAEFWADKGVDLVFCGSDVSCLKIGLQHLLHGVKEGSRPTRPCVDADVVEATGSAQKNVARVTRSLEDS